MRTIKLIDMTLRETGAIRDNTLSFKEKLEIARILDRLKADVIELPPLSGSKADQLSNKTIASTVKTGLSAAVDIASGNVGETWESIKNAAHPQLNLEAPVSTVQMEYVCHKKAPAMLELIREKVEACRYYCENVEFTALDASRAERDFLYKAVETAIEAGAGMITAVELGTGLLLNRQYQIWDYRSAPLNFLGQICLPYTLLWMPVALAGAESYRFLEKKMMHT
jgi:2-isopropylmalate synthase